MKKISDELIHFNNSNLPQIYYKYLWLLGQFIQHSLLYLQDIRVPEPPELVFAYPDKHPGELINIQRELYGCDFDWDTGTLIVSYQDAQFDVSIEAKDIIAKNVSNRLVDVLGFDDKGFDFNRACDDAIEIIQNIKNGYKSPL